jgi:hypothetical protein
MFAVKLKKAADKGRPLLLIVYPDGSMDLRLPERVYAGAVEYIDPRRGEARVIVPKHLLSYGKLRLAVVPAGFLESIGYEGLAYLSLPEEARRELQVKVADALSEVAKKSPEIAKKICEEFGLKVLPLYEPEDLAKPQVVKEIEQLAQAGFLPLEDAVKILQARVEGSFSDAAKAVKIMKKSGLKVELPFEAVSILERAAEVFHVKPEEVLLAERYRALGQIAEYMGRMAYYRKRFSIKQLFLIVGLVAVAVVLLLLLPQLFARPAAGVRVP